MTQEISDIVEQAIEESIACNLIVHIDAQEGMIDELTVRSDDRVKNGPVMEFWGVDDDGDAWRVHVTL